MKLLITIILNITCVLGVCAHDINKYKYFCLDVNDNPYGIETRLRDEFKKQGFFIIRRDFYKKLEPQEKACTLFAEYEYYINYNGPSTLSIFLKTIDGTQIWSASGQGCTLLSAKGDMRGATKQIMRKFSGLNYMFDEELAKRSLFRHPKADCTEDSIKKYLQTKPLSSPEGIYKNYSNDGNTYQIAVLSHEDKYYGVIVDSENDLWGKGDTKFILTNIESGIYDAQYYSGGHQKLNAVASLEDNRILSITAPYNGQSMVFSFLKIFPATKDRISPNGAINSTYVATGSGVLISDNVIVTNYHVIEDANRLEVVFEENGIQETYSARVLCTDKTNDLALICVKDDKYTKSGLSPFNIMQTNVDVGTSVFAMGYPQSNILGEELKVTDGIISAKSGFSGDAAHYQISAPIAPGNSGGPLFDKKGNLVGITSAGIPDKNIAENVGYAIKSPYILNLIDSAPISIKLVEKSDRNSVESTELVKSLRPYVVYIKVY